MMNEYLVNRNASILMDTLYMFNNLLIAIKKINGDKSATGKTNDNCFASLQVRYCCDIYFI